LRQRLARSVGTEADIGRRRYGVRIIQDQAHRGVHDEVMAIDLAAAAAFMTTHARLLDRRRFAVRFEGADPSGVLAALDAYRNPDGGYGALEPDLRAPESQPVGAMHAFEVFEDIAPATSPRAVELCDWLDSTSRPDGGLPFALPIADATGTAPLWAQADPKASSLHITTAVAAIAHRVARHDPAVAGHAWLVRVTGYCLDTLTARDKPESTLELLYALGFLDAIVDEEPAAAPLIDRLAAVIPASGALHVEGGLEDEVIRPLEFAPRPGRPVRRHFAPEVVAADLDRLAGAQHEDGGWDVDFTSYSPAAALDWRGWTTIHSLAILQANGRLTAPE
jgi:hypothetical protein